MFAFLAQVKAGDQTNQANSVSTLSTQWNDKKTLQQFNQVIIIMGVQTGDNQIVTTTKLKAFYFDLPEDAGINLKHGIYFIMKYNKLLAVHTRKSEIRKLLFKYKHGNDIHEPREQ